MPDTSDFERMEREGWAKPEIAKGYAEAFDLATSLVAERLCDAIGVGQGKRALDLCCGHGVVCTALADRGAHVAGLDFSPAMIDLARQTLPNVTFFEGDATATGLDHESLDAITIGFGIPHIPQPAQALAEAHRLLRPGGRLAFSVWCGAGSPGAFGWLFDAVARLGDPIVTLPAGPDAHAFADPGHAIPAMTAAGFTEITLIDVPSEGRLDAPETLFDAFDKGSVRAASLLGGQPSENRAAIRADLADLTRQKGENHGDHWRVPMPSVIVAATRP